MEKLDINTIKKLIKNGKIRWANEWRNNRRI